MITETELQERVDRHVALIASRLRGMLPDGLAVEVGWRMVGPHPHEVIHTLASIQRIPILVTVQFPTHEGCAMFSTTLGDKPLRLTHFIHEVVYEEATMRIEIAEGRDR